MNNNHSIDKVIGFKKTEILKIIQAFDSSFAFEPKKPVIQIPPKEYPLIYKNDYFDLAECESVITGYDPSDNWQCSERDQAYRLINSSLNNGLFECDKNNNYFISADNFRKWLKSKDIFIEGFSDITPDTPADNIGQPTINQPTPTNNQLSQQIAELTAQLASRDSLIAELEKQLNERLEAGTPAEPIGDNPSYTTTAITALNHVIRQFWQDWGKGTPATKQDYIVRWITDNYPQINPTMAKRIEQIARHETAK